VTLAASIHFTATGVYDENTVQTNAVDIEHAGNSQTLAAFKTAVSNAFANDAGGVLDFQTGTSTTGLFHIAPSRPIEVLYGIGGSEMLTLTSAVDLTRQVSHTDAAHQAIAISAGTTGSPVNGTLHAQYGNAFTLTFTGGKPIREVGVTALARNTYSDGTAFVTATFSDNTIDARSILGTALNDAGDEDTFLHFLAPTGTSIASLTFNGSGIIPLGPSPHLKQRILVDDLGFIAIPEPSTLMLLTTGLSTLGLIVYRRRRLLRR